MKIIIERAEEEEEEEEEEEKEEEEETARSQDLYLAIKLVQGADAHGLNFPTLSDCQKWGRLALPMGKAVSDPDRQNIH